MSNEKKKVEEDEESLERESLEDLKKILAESRKLRLVCY